MWECACGADNSASSPSCTTCGRIPGLAPAPQPVTERWDGADSRETSEPAEPAEPAGGPRRRRALPFSAAGRRAAGASRPPAGAPGPTRPRPEVRPTAAARPAEPVDPEATGRDATRPAPAPAAPAPETAEKAGKKRSFFDPEPEPLAPTASERRRRRITPTFVVAVLAIVVALGVLAYFIATTGNTKPPDQNPPGALIVPAA